MALLNLLFALPGLGSRETGIDPPGLGAIEPAIEPGPIENLPWCAGAVAGSSWLIDDSFVAMPDDPGLESPRVVDGDVTGGDICRANAGVLTLSNCTGTTASFVSFDTNPSSLDLVAAGVIGGECMDLTLGLL